MEKLRYAYLCLLTGIFSVLAQGQSNSQFNVTGKLVDADTASPLEFATVSFINNKSDAPPAGGITKADGTFEIEVPAGTYTVRYEYIGFATKTRDDLVINQDTDLGTIQLAQDAAQLESVVVQAERTTVDIRLDKKIYNIGQDLTVRGGTVTDVLDNVPSVSVDVEGNISLRGNESVRIFINGRPSALVGVNGADALRQIPADAIEKVEIITSPSARYDAEGTAGILNIILKKDENLGFNGSVQLNTGAPAIAGVGLDLNYRIKDWNFFTNTGANYRERPGYSFTNTEYFGTNARNRFVIEDRDFDRISRGLFTSLGAEYYIDDSSSIVGNIVYRYGDDDDTTTNIIERLNDNRNPTEATKRVEYQAEDEDDLQFSLDYINDLDDNGQRLRAIGQYSLSIEGQNSNIIERETIQDTINDVERVLEEEDEIEALLQVDYELPIGEDVKWEAGYRGNYRDISNSFFLAERLNFPAGPLVPDTGLNNTFTYRELVNAFYAQYGQEFGDFSILAGLRFEQTNVDIISGTLGTTDEKNYGSLFPTLNLGYEFEDDENITFGYNRRVNRPRGRFLNPFPSRSSESNIFRGNVDLDPTFSHQFELGYLKKWDELTFSSSAYYQTEDDDFEFIQRETGEVTDNGDPIIERFPINLSTENRYGLEATLTYRPFDWWTINSDFNLQTVETAGDFEDQNFDFVNTRYFARLNQKLEIAKSVDFQSRIFYRGPTENAQGSREEIVTVNLAASTELVEDVLILSASVDDLFNSRIRRSITSTPQFVSEGEFQWRERQFRTTLTYRFNQQDRDRRRERRRGNGNGGDFDFEEG